MKPFNDISSVITELQNALACATRIFDLLEEEPESPDPSGTLVDVKGAVDIRNVSFRYEADKPLIKNLIFIQNQADVLHRRPYRLWQDNFYQLADAVL